MTIVFRLLSVEQWDDTRLSQRFKAMQRDGFRCVLCGRSPATERGCRLHVDHIAPRSQGGGTAADNLRTLCRECNIGRGNRYDADDRPVTPARKNRQAPHALALSPQERGEGGNRVSGRVRGALLEVLIRTLTRLADFLRRQID